MKEFLKDIFPRIIQYSKSLDDQTVLTNKSWVLISDDSKTREVWIFKRNNELIFSRDGIADKGTWEYLPESKSLYIEIGEVKRLINKAFVDDVILLLRLDGGKDFIALANENKINETFKIEAHLVQYLPESRKKEEIKPRKLTTEERIAIEKGKLENILVGAVVISVSFFAGGLMLIFIASDKFELGAIFVCAGIVGIFIGALAYQDKYSVINKLKKKKILDDLSRKGQGDGQ